MLAVRICLFVCFVGIVTAEVEPRKRYDGYQLVELKIKTELQMKNLQKLHGRHSRGIILEDSTIRVGGKVEALLAPYIRDVFWKVIDNAEIEIEVTNYNIQKFLDAEFERLDNKLAYDPNDYNTYEQMQEELTRLASVCPEGFQCEVDTIGHSTFGNEINAILISQPSENKEVIWIDSLIHSREWIAGTSIMKTAAQVHGMDQDTSLCMTPGSTLIEGYGIDEDATYLMNGYDFVILPVFNPDGYIHTWESDRMWRKNRNTIEGSTCLGIDLNRNHRHHWGEQPGSDDNPCGETFMGPSAASEIEVQVVESAVERLVANRPVAMLMSVHTAAEAWLMPWGFQEDGQCAFTPDHDDQLRVSEAAVAAVAEAGGSNWVAGATCDVLYPATGITPDFAYGIAGIKYSFTPELRGPGFAPGQEHIQPAFDEWFAGVVAAVKERELIELAHELKKNLY